MALFDPAEEESHFEWSEMLHQVYFRARLVVSRLWWVLVICMAIGIGIQWYNESQREPEYRSVAQMVIDGQVTIPEGARYQEVWLNFFGTQIKLMQSQQVRQRASQRVAALHPELKPCHVDVAVRQADDASAFDLQAVGPEPEYTQRFLDAVMHEFLAYKAERRRQTTEKTFITIMEKVVEKQQEIEDLEEEKLNFQRANNIVFITEQGSNAGTYLAELNNKKAQIKTELRLLGAMSQSGAGQRLDPFTESKLSALDESYEAAKREVDRLRAECDEFSIYMKDAHPKVRRLKQEIERQENLLNIYRRQSLGQLQDRKAKLEAELVNLDDVIDDWETQALKYSTLLAEFERMNSRLASAKAVHDRLLASIDSLDITQNTHQETISVLQFATKAYPVPMDTRKHIAMGALFGLIIGAGLLFMVSTLDTRVVSAEDLSNRFEPPLLGLIPLQQTGKGDLRLDLLKPGDDRVMFAESCRNIRSSLLFMDRDGQRPQVILVTSAVPSEGKSTLASNLSITLAFAQSKVLLVDADLRRGRVHTEFDCDCEPGFADLLENHDLSLKDVTRDSGSENLDIITCGDYPERPGELLLSRRFDELLEQMRSQYDYILFDCPPVLATDDTPSFATKAEAVLFMVRSNYTRLGQIRSSLDVLALRGVQVDGFVLNFVDSRQPSQYYYYNRYYDYYTYRSKGKKSGKEPTRLSAS